MKKKFEIKASDIPLRITIDVRPTKEFLKTSVAHGDINVEYLEEVIEDVLVESWLSIEEQYTDNEC